MIDVYLPIILALIIALTYYYSNKHTIKDKERSKKIVSFSAGVAITYVLLKLFPTFTEGVLSINKLLFISLLFGFIIHHIIEKEIYTHTTKHELIKMLSLEENVFSFVYHIIIGFILATFIKENIIQGLLFFVPMAFYTFLSMLPSKPHHSKKNALLLSIATPLGVLIALFLGKFMPLWLEYALIGLATGVLLFAVIRHHIPFGKRGKISYFTIGFLLYAILIIASWYI